MHATRAHSSAHKWVGRCALMRVRARGNKARDDFPVGNQSDRNREARLRAKHTKICYTRPLRRRFPRLAVGLLTVGLPVSHGRSQKRSARNARSLA
jgi:hypothetical protein